MESLAACPSSNSALILHSTVNKAFVNYLTQFENLTDSLEHPNPPILVDKMTFQQTLPVSLHTSKFDSTSLTAPQMLKDFVHQYQKKKEIFDLKERFITMNLETPKKFLFQ